MPSVSDSHREVAHERATARALRSLTDRVLTECVLPAWVVYIVALCRLPTVVLAFSRAVRSKSWQRRLVCFAVMFSLLLWPGSGLFTKRAIAATLLIAKSFEARVSRIVRSDEAYLLASLVLENMNRHGLYVSTDSAAVLASMFLQSSNPPQHETMQDRANAVAHIRISPVKLVGYEGEGIPFGAIAGDSSNHTIQGVKFSWSSSDTNKLQINEAGEARFLQPGLVKVICRAGTVEVSSPVLIRLGHRPPQTDADWLVDQVSFNPNVTVGVTGGPGEASDFAPSDDEHARGSSSVINKLARGASSMIDKLANNFAPTAFAQIGGPYIGSDFPYDELWSEPRNLVGTPPYRVIEPTRIGPVLPESSNYQLAIPFAQIAGRGGVGLDAKLYFNSRVWFRHGNAVTFDAIASWPSPGFTLRFERIVAYGPSNATKYILIDRDGTRRFLGAAAQGQQVTLRTTDGSNLVFVGDPGWYGTLHYPDGTTTIIQSVNNRMVATQITDKNGNFISIYYNSITCDPNCANCWDCPIYWPSGMIGSIVDSLGRVIEFNYDSDFKLISITAPGGGVQFSYESRVVSGNFSGLTVENRPLGAVNFIKRVCYGATGTGVLFNYSDFGVATSVSFRRQMIDSNGNLTDGVETAAVSFNYLQSGTLTDAPGFTQRTETAVNALSAVYAYSAPDSNYLQNALTFAITQPAVGNPPSSKILFLSRSNDTTSPDYGKLVQAELKNGTNSFAKTKLNYLNNGGSSPQVQSVTSFDDTGTQTKVDFDYDSYGNVTNRREYGFQISGAFQVRRRTHYTYKTDQVYLDLYLRSLVTAVEVYDAQQDTNDTNDGIIAKRTYEYDNYGHFGGWVENYGLTPTTYPPGYQVTPGGSARGDVTGTTEWTDIQSGSVIQHFAAYDLFGNVIKASVSCCQEKDSTLTQNTYWSQTETEMSGDPNGTHLATSTDYNFNTSLPVGATDAGGLVTHYAYNGALDLTNVNLPTGATVVDGYDYAHLSRSSTVSYTDGTDEFGNPITKTITTSEQYDGWGRVIQSVDRNGGQVNKTYDAMGRVASRTNPFPAGGTPGSATTFQYDALGRVTVTTLPDGNTVRNDYSGPTVTATDQVGRKIKRETDGLGRLIKVTEQDVSTGLLTQETTYSYNLLNKLTEVNQGGQTRAYKYDGIGRLLYERIPEQAATISDGAGGMWSCKYTYNEWNGLATKQDARGVITTFSYDALHRGTQKSYNTVGATGVASTATVNYFYDWTVSGTLAAVYGDGYQESYSYDGSHQLSSVNRNALVTSYQYNGASQVTQITYPSGNVVGVGYDFRGRLGSVGAFAGSMTYNIEGRPTGQTLGNGVVESRTFDVRSQLVTETAARSGASLMNLSYFYQASAGQSGTNTTQGNTHQLVSTTGTINGTTESAAFTYDLQRRLVTSSETSNGVNAQRRYDYDRWGNRSGEWDATSGGNQIQSVALEQSGGAPTNRVQSVSGAARTNVALAASGATVTASSTYSSAYPESSVINGDRKGVNWGNSGGWNDANTDFPDWVQVSFNGSKTINEIDVFTLQDNYANPSEPTESMTFSQFGITDFQVQYWNGSWQTVPGGSVSANNKVWRKFTFSNITTDKIRVYITGALASYSRLTEIEAYSNTNNYVYDAAGNVTNDGAHSYTYDAENRLVLLDNGATAQYWYDHQNRRIKKVAGGNTVLYVWDGNNLLAEHDGTVCASYCGADSSPYGERSSLVDYIYVRGRLVSSRHYVHPCGTNHTVWQYGCWNWTDRYYVSDIWSTRLVMDASGNVIGRMGHLPFGEEFAESGTQEKHHFTSYDLDESATDYGINRQYSPSVGRFQQADPYQASGYLVNPQSWNRYSYVENDPIHNIDPRGLLEGVPNIEMPDPCVGGLLTPISSIYKVYNFRLRCSPKTATQAMSDLKKIFTDLASYYEGFGGDGIDFERVPITDNARISIHLLYGDLIIPFTADVHVDVIKNDPFGWAFATESDHVFYPGKISFRMQNIPNDSGKNILFTITVIGVINGRLNEIAFDNGIDTFEDTVWHRLGDAVQARICGI